MKGKIANDPFWQAMGVGGISSASEANFFGSIDRNISSVVKEIHILAETQYDEAGRYATKGSYLSDLTKHAKIESYTNALMTHTKPKKIGEYPEEKD